MPKLSVFGLLLILGVASAYAETVSLSCPQVVPGKTYSPNAAISQLIILGKSYTWRADKLDAVQYESSFPWTKVRTGNMGDHILFLFCDEEQHSEISLIIDGGKNAQCHNGKRILSCSGSGKSSFSCDIHNCGAKS